MVNFAPTPRRSVEPLREGTGVPSDWIVVAGMKVFQRGHVEGLIRARRTVVAGAAMEVREKMVKERSEELG